MILIHVLVRVGVHVCSHHLVHYSPCLQTRNLDETTRFGCVSLRLWFVLLGCALGVLWVAGWLVLALGLLLLPMLALAVPRLRRHLAVY